MRLRTKISVLLALALTVNGMAFINPVSTSAAKKVSLSTKKLTVKVGQSKKLKLKNNKKKVKWTVTSGEKNIVLKSKKKTGVTVVGKKKGKAKVRVKIGKKKYTCKVTVKAKAKNKATPTPTAKATPTPMAKETPTPTAKETPTPTAKVTSTPTKVPGQDEVQTLYYNDGNAEEVRKQIKDSDVPVYVIVENSVTSIGWHAFGDCSSLTSISIPDSVTSIGDHAFKGVDEIRYSGTASGAPWGAGKVIRQ